jgi:hypothetical protein
MRFVLGLDKIYFSFNAISRNASCQSWLPDSANVAVQSSIVYKVILPEITTLRTRNPLKE